MEQVLIDVLNAWFFNLFLSAINTLFLADLIFAILFCLSLLLRSGNEAEHI
jgi:hypothetical protein